MELIRALAQQPDLLILDNAFNGLDASSRILLSQLLKQLVIEKQSVVMTGLKKYALERRSDLKLPMYSA